MDMSVCRGCNILRRTGWRFTNSRTLLEKKPVERKFDLRPACNISYKNTIHPYQIPFEFVTRRLSTRSNLLTNNILTLYSRSTAPIFIRGLQTISSNALVTYTEMESVLHGNETPFKKGYAGYLTSCNHCKKSNESQPSLPLFIDMRTGESVCRSCGVKYNWETFKKENALKTATSRPSHTHTLFDYEMVKPLEHEEWLFSEQLTELSKEDLTEHFPLKNIPSEILQQYHVRSNESNNTLMFPYYDITRQCVSGLKMYKSNSSKPSVVSGSGQMTLFGWHLIKPDHNVVVLTANEFDCIAITRATGLPSLSLPYGVSKLPPDCLPFLEQFEEIILWFSGDEYRAKENLLHFASKLSLSRCSKVTSSKGAFKVLDKQGVQLVKQLIEERWDLSHDDIFSFKELRNEVLSTLVNSKENAGVPFTRFPSLNEYLKGHRRGELTIFTGPTGSGKTTFLSELSIDLAMQGVKTLWGSFEIKNIRLASIMLRQFSGVAIENHMNAFPHWSEEFEKLPMYFMNYYGSQELSRVIDTIEYAIYTYDIEHIIIDNLQFMVNAKSGEDRFDVMDDTIAAFRKCASDHNVHVTVVIHPRKENDGTVLLQSSIYGTAKSTQEADNVMILQSAEKTMIQISKNRFSGTIGAIPLCFDPNSLCMSGFHRDAGNNSNDSGILPKLPPVKMMRNLKVYTKK